MIRHTLFVLTLVGTILCGQLLATITSLGSIDPAYDASDPWVVGSEEFIVGFEGDGTLTINAGSDVTVAGAPFIGDYADEYLGTSGTLILTGSGSTLTIESGNGDDQFEFFIGPRATGYLSIRDQAVLSSYDAIIGGSLLMEGEEDPGAVNGVVPGAGHVEVTGGAQWTLGDWGWVTVGALGTGELAIQDTSEDPLATSVTADASEIGLLPDSVGDVLVGPSGTWTLTDDLVVGVWGEGNLMVSGGGQVQSGRGWIGGVDPDLMGYTGEPVFDGLGNPNGIGNVLVTGQDSRWDAGDSLVVGAWGTGTLGIEDGGTVTATDVFIGGMPITLGAEEEFTRDLMANGTGTVTVTGDDSLLEVFGDDSLYVGYSGEGTLNIENGGAVTSGNVVIGGAPDSTGTVLVTGVGTEPGVVSTLTAENIQVGAWGTGELTVSDGAEVTTNDLVIGGTDASDTGLDQRILDDFGDATGTGTVTVTEGGSLDVDGTSYVGAYGVGTLNVTGGGQAITGELAVGVASGSEGFVVVDGTDETGDVASRLEVDDETGVEGEGYFPGVMIVGGYGTGDVQVRAGGELTVDDILYIGGYPAEELNFQGVGAPAGTGTVTVTGAGSLLNGGDIAVGYSGEGTLNIQNGAEVQTEGVIVGLIQDAGVGHVLVDGQAGDDRSTLRIESDQEPEIGDEPPDALGEGELIVSNGGQVFVSGYGALDVADRISVGSQGAGSMTISGGGTVTTDEFDIGGLDPDFDTLAEYLDPGTVFTEGAGDVAVTGDGSSLTVESLVVGFAGTGTMDVGGGASLTSHTAFLGAVPDATGTMEVGGGSTWNAGENIVVGLWGHGDLTISGDAEVATQVTTGEMYIGGAPFELVAPEGAEFNADQVPDGTGVVTVTGNSVLNVVEEETLYVGYAGTGELHVEDGAQVTTDRTVIGGAPDVLGTVEIDGGDMTVDSRMIVGAWGDGTVDITSGSLTASQLYVGGFDAATSDMFDVFGPADEATGIVTVDGGESTLTADTLFVGYSGDGTLNVLNDATATSATTLIGVTADGVGHVLVENAPNTWTNTGTVVVGAYGEGDLTVRNNGHVAIGEVLYIGGYDPEELVDVDLGYGYAPNGAGVVTVENSGSLLEAMGIGVGAGGTGTLEILNGAEVQAEGVVVGLGQDGVGNVLVDGAGSTLRIQSEAADGIPTADGEGEVVVSNGGQVIVDGAGVLGVADKITVGSEGIDNSMTISDGGFVSSAMGVIGGDNPQFENMADYFDPDTVFSDGTGDVMVTGAGSRWDTGHLEVGFSGDGALSIENGGYVWDETAVVGMIEGVTGTVEVTGAGSTWDNLDNLVVGAWGAGELTISAGGTVYATDAYIGGMPLDVIGAEDDPDYTPTGTGIVTVTGGDSAFIVEAPASLYVGYSGAGTLNVDAGGYVESLSAGIGALPGSVGNVTVDGVYVDELAEIPEVIPSEWHNSGSVFVGGYGTGTLTVSDRGLVDIEGNLYIGGFDRDRFGAVAGENEPDGVGTVTVTGPDSTLYGTGLQELYVGYSGQGTLNVLDGGYVESGIAAIGALPGSVGHVTVDGVHPAENEIQQFALVGDGGLPSAWENLGSMAVGGYGDGFLTVSGGGEVFVGTTLYIGGYDPGPENFPTVEGVNPSGTGNVEVTGAGSLLVVGGPTTLHVGHSGQGHLDILDGGQVVSQTSNIGTSTGSDGEVNVNDGTWNNDGRLYVGREGDGSLRIANGGLVSTTGRAFLGFGEDSVGNARVADAGSLWEVGESLFVGGHDEGSAGEGVLQVLNGGEVVVANELYIWDTGRVEGDGTITVAAADTVHNYGTIAPGNEGVGTLTVNGDVVFHEGSTYAVEINNNDQSDKLEVDGNVSIEGGAVQVDSVGTIMGEHEYEIISADAVQGEFDDLDTALLDFSFESIDLAYEQASVWLRIAAANFNDPSIARTYNQHQVAGALQDIGGEGGNDVTDAVQDLETVDDVRDSYDQLSGQTRPSLAPMTVAGTSKFLGTVTSRVQTVRTGLVAGAFDSSLMASAGPDQAVGGSPAFDVAARGQDFTVGNGSSVLADRRWGLWGRGYGLFGDRDSEGGVPGYAYNIYGGSFGVDYQFTESFLAGLVGGMSEGDVDFDRSRDNTDFGAAHVGLYGSLAWDRWDVDSVVTYANLDYETERFVDALSEQLMGNFDGYEIAGYVEVSRSFDLAPDLGLAPLASMQYTYLNLDSYSETGGASALSFDEQSHESIRGSLGARLTKRLIESAGDFRADLQVRGRWVHEFGDDQASVDTSFASDPAVIFTIKDEETSRDSAVLGTGLSAEFSKRTRAYVDYDARLNSDETIHVLSASLQYRW